MCHERIFSFDHIFLSTFQISISLIYFFNEVTISSHNNSNTLLVSVLFILQNSLVSSISIFFLKNIPVDFVLLENNFHLDILFQSFESFFHITVLKLFLNFYFQLLFLSLNLLPLFLFLFLLLLFLQLYLNELFLNFWIHRLLFFCAVSPFNILRFLF